MSQIELLLGLDLGAAPRTSQLESDSDTATERKNQS